MARMFCLLAALLAPAAALAQAGPVDVVRSTTNQLFDRVQQQRAEYERDSNLLYADVRAILEPQIDTIYAARLVLGRNARGLEADRIEAFASALSGLLIRRYADGLLGFRSRDQVEILPLSGDNSERMTRVRTRVRLDSGQHAPVDYVLRRGDAQWQVFDVVFEGISYIATLRNQINEELRVRSFDQVLERLQSGEIPLDFGEETQRG